MIYLHFHKQHTERVYKGFFEYFENGVFSFIRTTIKVIKGCCFVDLLYFQTRNINSVDFAYQSSRQT